MSDRLDHVLKQALAPKRTAGFPAESENSESGEGDGRDEKRKKENGFRDWCFSLVLALTGGDRCRICGLQIADTETGGRGRRRPTSSRRRLQEGKRA